MDTEDMVRGALRDEAARVAVADWSAGPVRVQVRRQRRGRRMAAGAAAVVAALAVAAGTGTVLSSQHGPQAAGPASQAQAPRVPAGPPPEALVVEPGRQLPLDRQDWWMQLKDQEICIHDAPAYGSGPGCSGHSWTSGATEITMQYYGNPPLYHEALYNLVYHGPGQVARMAIEVDGQAYWATVASLPGNPGYATGYVWGPGRKTPDDPKALPLQDIRLAAYDAQGRVLASKTLPS
ncbi:hypothetical protein J5Y04_16170 [Kitasatospora sp. RG8]|uniref:hypothetical protein n=1 Tax=Kitasatospora sp. RG8 TaxID=2820815 RepID=UPI001AE05F1D|nr:hypothetical protein [Kitasatospora sp. RG8]MBP0451067.1 hypothetical protein [Kitasatospora sp. RG8]